MDNLIAKYKQKNTDESRGDSYFDFSYSQDSKMEATRPSSQASDIEKTPALQSLKKTFSNKFNLTREPDEMPWISKVLPNNRSFGYAIITFFIAGIILLSALTNLITFQVTNFTF